MCRIVELLKSKKKAFEKVSSWEDRYKNFEYEKMTQNKKDEILRKYSNEEIEKAKKELNLELELFYILLSSLQTVISFEEMIKLSSYDRYRLSSFYYNIINSIAKDFNKIDEESHFIYSLKEYEYVYIQVREIIIFLQDLMALLQRIKKFNMGVPNKKEKETLALKNTINTLQKEVENTHVKWKIKEKLFYSVHAYSEKDTQNYIREANLELMNASMDRYKIFEQVILAPLKIARVLEQGKSEFRKSFNEDFMINLMKNIGITNSYAKQVIEDIKKNEKDFYEISMNQVIPYCVTVLCELHHIRPDKLIKLYTRYYSNATLSTRFFNREYNHIKLKGSGYIEFLPYLQKDFEHIFYEVISAKKDDIKEILNALT